MMMARRNGQSSWEKVNHGECEPVGEEAIFTSFKMEQGRHAMSFDEGTQQSLCQQAGDDCHDRAV